MSREQAVRAEPRRKRQILGLTQSSTKLQIQQLRQLTVMHIFTCIFEELDEEKDDEFAISKSHE